MRRASLAALLLVVSFPAPATTIPADLEARAAVLRSHAPPALVSWTREHGVTLSKGGGPVDLSALEKTVRTTWTVLGNMQGADIEAICFLVLMEAAKSAQEDLKATMASVKAINNAKAQQRESLERAQAQAAALRTPTPTPPPDRIAQFVTAARRVEPKTAGADLSKLVRR